MSAQNTLIGFAVLRANYNAQAASYIDNFHPFALDALRDHTDGVTAPQASSYIRNQFGLTIPDLVVEKILKRLCKKSLATRKDAIFMATKSGLNAAPGITQDIERYKRQHNNLVEMYTKFVKSELPEHAHILDDDPSTQLAEYLEFHSVPILAQSLSISKKSNHEFRPGSEYAISRFISNLAESSQAGFSYVEDTVKGAILASVVTLDTSGFSQSLKNLNLYFDTPSLIKALGFEGKESELASDQLISLAKSQGSAISCFQHTLQELDGVLQGTEHFLRNPHSRGIMRPIDAHFQECRASAVDIALERTRLTDSIQNLGIEIRTKPGDYSSYGLDENKLEESLSEFVKYRNESSKRYDIDSLSAIHRLRKGGVQQQLEKSGSVLVTANSGVVKASHHFNSDTRGWPLAMTESTLAAILWARSPSIGSDVPRQQILATASAAMQPDPHLWGKYIEEVENLEKSGRVGADDAIILRSTSVARSALMEATLGINEEVTSESTLDVLNRIRSEIEEPLVRQLKSVEQNSARANEAAEETARSWMEGDVKISELRNELRIATETSRTSTQQLKLIEDANRRIDTNIANISVRRAKFLITALMSITATSMGILAGLKIWNPTWIQGAPTWVGIASLASAVILATIAAIRAFKPGTVQDWLKPCELWLGRRIEKRRRTISGRDAEESYIDKKAP